MSAIGGSAAPAATDRATPLRILTHLPVGLLGRVVDAFPDVEITELPGQGALPDGAAGEILLTHARGSANLAEVVVRGVRWVHGFGTGVDGFPLQDLGGALLTCSRGASADAIAEWVLAVMLACEKQLPERWHHETLPSYRKIVALGGLRGRTLGLVGFGAIAQAVAWRALAFDMRVLAVRRTAAASPIARVTLVPRLEDLLPEADHLVIAAPATPHTRHLIARAALKRVKPGVHLVNIARGSLVDQEALREALDAGRVRLASLDVVDPEPLPAGHWLYTHPSVRLSAHISWSAPWALDSLIQPFVDNLHRWRAGEPLEGVVDLDAGY